MDFKEYSKLAQRTANQSLTANEKQMNGLFGIIGEAGELMDLYKKHYFQNHDFCLDKITEELGDIIWYIVELCAGLNIELENVAKFNIDKLKKRYPSGFEASRSINRKQQ